MAVLKVHVLNFLIECDDKVSQQNQIMLSQ